MRSRGVGAAVLALLLTGASHAGATIEASATLDPFGEVALYRESTHPTRVVLLLSDADGWGRAEVESARAIASLDALVVGVDVRRYLATMAERGSDELYPSADLEVLSQFVQKKMRLPTYLPPIVCGQAAGATMAYAVAAQAHPTSFAGAISLGFCPEVAVPKPLGRGSGLLWDAGAATGTYVLRPATALAAPWVVLQGHAHPGCEVTEVRRFVDAAPGAVLVELPTHESVVDPEWWLPDVRHALERMGGAQTTNAPVAGEIGDLPLVEVPARGTPTALAVILSGDGGWASLDRGVGDALAASGVGVVGLNSLSYFWTTRTPDGAAADLARVLRHYRDAWHVSRVVLIGYSRGADVLPFLASRLPAELRSTVQLIALLGPVRTTDFEFHLTDWLGGNDPTALPIAPEVEKLRDLRLLCVQGEQEDDSLCPTLDATLAHRFVLPGAHHFGGDYGVIAARILAEAGAPAQPSLGNAPP